MIVIYDTETTGFPSKKRVSHDKAQAHLVQIAAQLVTTDNELVMEFSTLVASPVPSHEKAEAVHGISFDHAQKYGMEEGPALSILQTMFIRADQRVAHNMQFDDAVIHHGHVRNDTPFQVKAMTDPICTMEVVKRMNLGGSNLAFCMQHFFGEDFEGHHDAMEDVKATRRLLFELRRQGRI